jgi:hypothetical protein
MLGLGQVKKTAVKRVKMCIVIVKEYNLESSLLLVYKREQVIS